MRETPDIWFLIYCVNAHRLACTFLSCFLLLTLNCPFLVAAGDRYDAEPRSRGYYEQSATSHYDEDPRGPVRPYLDVGEEASFKNHDPDRTIESSQDKQEEEAG